MSEVDNTAELRRVLDLPRREPQDWDALAADMTDLLSVRGRCDGAIDERGICECGSPTRLRRAQALALHDIAIHRGALLPIGVGEGKTLIFWLTPHVLEARDMLGLLPASLIKNAEDARTTLSRHWRVPVQRVRLLSYELLGRAQCEKILEDPNYQPDAIGCDEAHRLKNLGGAACARRIARYMAKHPRTAFVAMSGTVMRDSLKDFAHLAWWALKEGTPLPADPRQLDEWAAAIDEPKPGAPDANYREVEPGALLLFANEEERRLPAKQAARLGFRRRLTETPGIVAAAGEGEDVGASIYVTAKQYDVEPVTEAHFAQLRSAWERPDGKRLEQGVDVWRHARELALGFHYEWDPPPPEPWMDARRAWSAYVRGVLAYSKTLDSPLTVINALDSGKRKDSKGVALLAAWRAVRDSFRPKTKAVWHDDSVLELTARWMKGGGIVWTEHGFFAHRLARETGATYYGAKGLSADGEYIEHSKAKSIIASIDANRDGKNLQTQGWERMLILSPPDGWDAWQQALARIHRPGFRGDALAVDFLLGCREHVSAWTKAWAGTEAARDTVGAKPKLLLADVDVPDEDELDALKGARWRRTGPPPEAAEDS